MSEYTDELNRLLNRLLLVKFKRTCEPDETETGFVRGLSRDLLLLQAFDWNTFRCIDWRVLRHADVKVRDICDDTSAWPYPAFKRRRIRLTTAPAIDLRSMAAAIRSAAKCAPLFSVYREQKYPGECWIGRRPRCRNGRLTIQTISTRAIWEDDYTLELKDITKVVIGDGYGAALAIAAGDQ